MINCNYYNETVFNNLNLSAQEILLLKSINDFYSNDIYFNLLENIINGTSEVSRRTFEYFVTNYVMTHNISYEIIENGIKTNFVVYNSYKDQLKAHHKKYFDPFGRGDRIPFFSKNNCIITTIGQLNFYRWFFSKKLYDYCIEKYSDIQGELVINKNNIKKTNKKQIKIIQNIKKQVNYVKLDFTTIKNNNIVVSFD